MTEPRGAIKPSLILGTAQFDIDYGVTRRSKPELDVCKLLVLAHNLGIETLDTAQVYETAHAKIKLCGWNGAIHTKILDGNTAQESLKESLRSLGRERLEVAYFHDPRVLRCDLSFFQQTYSQLVPTLVDSLGVSIYTPEEFTDALSNPFIDIIQTPINIVDQRISDEKLREAALKGKRIVARSIFLQGVLLQNLETFPDFLGSFSHVIDRLEAITSKTGLSRIEILLRAVLCRPAISSIIVGTDSREQLNQIVSAYHKLPLQQEFDVVPASLKVDSLDLIDPRRWPNSGG